MDGDSWTLQYRPPSYRTVAEDTDNSSSPSSGFAGSPHSISDHSSAETSLIDGPFYAIPTISSLSLSLSMDTPRTLAKRLFRSPIRFNTATPPSRPSTPALAPDATLLSDNVNSDEASVPRPFLLKRRRSFGPSPTLNGSAIQNVTYTFMPTGFNTMSLVPHPVLLNEGDSQYNVTVNMNYFMPLSHITQIHHGLRLVAEFEMGIIASPNTLKISGHSGPISSVLSKSGSRNKGSWFWNPLNVGLKYCLKWDYDKRPCRCYSTAYADGPILAYFTSPHGLDSTSEFAILEVSPAGQEFFDHILTSLMIIERKRLTPDKETSLKPLFN